MIVSNRAVLLVVSLATCLALPGILRAEFETENGWNDQLFPSFMIATATI
jgi:hypothetical protein